VTRASLALLVLLAACNKPRIRADVQPDAGPPADAGPKAIVFEALANGGVLVDGTPFDEHDAGGLIVTGRPLDVRAAEDVTWGHVIHALDIAKQRGAVDNIFLVAPSRRTRPLRLPKASNRGMFFPNDAGEPPDNDPTVYAVALDSAGHAFFGGAQLDDAAVKAKMRGVCEASDAIVIINADATVAFGRVLDMTIAAQQAPCVGVTFGVQPIRP
jgi:biopolymer transport protein ExbD